MKDFTKIDVDKFVEAVNGFEKEHKKAPVLCLMTVDVITPFVHSMGKTHLDWEVVNKYLGVEIGLIGGKNRMVMA